MAKKVPPRRLYHDNWRRAQVQNSRRGNVLAHEQGKPWIDNDWLLSLDKRTWENRHGWPEQMTPAQIKACRDAREAFADADHFGQSVEAEIKNLTPITDDELRDSLARMKRQAIAAFGERWWTTRVNLKIVSTIGPAGYALRVARIARDLGFVVLITVRGKDRFRRTWPDSVAYVRGALVPVR